MFSRTAAEHALSATMTSTLYVLAAIGILFGRQTGSFQIAGLGVGTIAVLVAYLLGIRLVFYDQQAAFIATEEKLEAVRDRGALRRAILVYLVSAAAIVLAAPFLSAAAGRIADLSGLGKTFVGTTAVALCTSLPEIVTSYAAVRMGAFDLALGNIFGCNCRDGAALPHGTAAVLHRAGRRPPHSSGVRRPYDCLLAAQLSGGFHP